MDFKAFFAKWAQSQVDAAVSGAEREPPGVSIQAQHIHIGDVNHNHATQAAPERISDAQSRLLKVLVGRFGKAERARNPAYSDARTWGKVNGLAGVDHHRDMLKRDFDRAKAYLEGWLRSLG